jgi:hypothetical protein
MDTVKNQGFIQVFQQLGITQDHGAGNQIGTTSAIAVGASFANFAFKGFFGSGFYGAAHRHIHAVLKLFIEELSRVIHPAHLNGDQAQQCQTRSDDYKPYSIRFHYDKLKFRYKKTVKYLAGGVFNS